MRSRDGLLQPVERTHLGLPLDVREEVRTVFPDERPTSRSERPSMMPHPVSNRPRNRNASTPTPHQKAQRHPEPTSLLRSRR